MDGETITRELRRDLLVDLDEHVVRAAHNTLLAILLADAVCQAKLVQGNL